MYNPIGVRKSMKRLAELDLLLEDVRALADAAAAAPTVALQLVG